MGKTDHGDNCQGENGGVKTAWGKCLWGFTDRIICGRVCSETLHQNLTYFSNSNYCYFFQKKKEEEEADASTNKAVNLPMKNEPTTTGDPEKDKKIRKINDKLTQIAKLKEQVKSGKQLEVNQLEKIKKESELLEELKSLRL